MYYAYMYIHVPAFASTIFTCCTHYLFSRLPFNSAFRNVIFFFFTIALSRFDCYVLLTYFVPLISSKIVLAQLMFVDTASAHCFFVTRGFLFLFLPQRFFVFFCSLATSPPFLCPLLLPSFCCCCCPVFQPQFN